MAQTPSYSFLTTECEYALSVFTAKLLGFNELPCVYMFSGLDALYKENKRIISGEPSDK